jgi:hypothetical protein
MLPREGVVQCVFLLAYAARLTQHPNLEEWIRGAKSFGSYVSAAADLQGIAQNLIHLKLAEPGNHVKIAPSLERFSYVCDRFTMLGIAQMLLAAAKPNWLVVAVNGTEVSREFIPTSDLDALCWLDPELDELLISAAQNLSPADDHFKAAIGLAAELILVSVFRAADLRPIHVSQISDSYGYDIKLTGNSSNRIEVKAASLRTQEGFFLTRNEYEKCCLFGEDWLLIQVVFKGEAFTAPLLLNEHVAEFRSLKSSAIKSLIPSDSKEFKWIEGAYIQPAFALWEPMCLPPGHTFKIDGFKSLGIG